MLGRPDKKVVRLEVNGDPCEVAVEPRTTLLEALRYQLKLTGSKQGCDKGDCGACTVLIDGRPRLSCITLAVQAEGRKVTTIEGLAQGGQVHPVQDAFDLCGALQCGFCQSGMMLSAAALLEKTPRPTREQIKAALCGQPLPLHRLHPDHRRGRGGGRPARGERARRAAHHRGRAVNTPPKSSRGGVITTPGGVAAARPATSVVGRRLRKLDGLKKATGEAIYADDIQLPRMLHCKLLRSPHAHARIKKIDFTRCLAHPGVVEVLQGSELPTRYGVIPWTQDEQALNADKVRFIGDAVAAVAAVDELAAEEALELIDVEYEVLPALVEPEAALDDAQNELHEANKHGNVTKHVKPRLRRGRRGDGEERRGGRGRLLLRRLAPTPRSSPTARSPSTTARATSPSGSSTQIPHYVHRELARVLELAPRAVRVIQPLLGGAFGGKSDPFSLEFVVAKLAMKTGRPVKCLFTREEVFCAHRGRHPMKMRFKVGLAKDGAHRGGRLEDPDRRRRLRARSGWSPPTTPASCSPGPTASRPTASTRPASSPTSRPAGPSAATAACSPASPSRSPSTWPPRSSASIPSRCGGATSSASRPRR